MGSAWCLGSLPPQNKKTKKQMKTTLPTVQELTDLGFRTAAYELGKHKELGNKGLREKLRVAFEHYRVVEPEHIARFNEKLKANTLKKTTRLRRTDYNEIKLIKRTIWQALQFTPIHNYTAAPPREVLVELKRAKDIGCFDSFEIATINEVRDEHVQTIRMEDPILFGRIENSDNRYFIAQWDDDVKIEDILREDEG
jgi:hypothetical protein